MKNSIKSLALFVAAGFPVVAFAEFLGVRFPAAVSAESLIGVFSVALIALLVVGDYSRRSSVRLVGSQAKVCRATAETHCLAA